jgi:hypothetical protein
VRHNLLRPRFVIPACIIFAQLIAALAVMYFEGIVDGPWPYTDGTRIVAEEPTHVFSSDPGIDPDPSRGIAILQSGETADVITRDYGKDYMYYKVRLKDGRKGYILFSGHNEFRVVRVTSPVKSYY